MNAVLLNLTAAVNYSLCNDMSFSSLILFYRRLYAFAKMDLLEGSLIQ